MDLLMNGLLTAATLFAGGYCWVLAAGCTSLKSLDNGLGGAIVTLTRQIELARADPRRGEASSRDTRQDLSQLVASADAAAGQLRLLIAAAPLRRPRAAGTRASRRGRTRLQRPRPPRPPSPKPPRLWKRRQCPSRRPRPCWSPRSGRRRRPTADAPAPPPRPVPHLAEVPKPRALAPIENPLRRAKPVVAQPIRSEDEILEALSALASGGR